jgi:chitin-binding protein
MRKRILLLPGITLGAVVGSMVLLALPASAHGYVMSPPSRQAYCAQGVVDCGQIKYEPQSVEGPKGLHSCDGGNEQFADLNDNSKPWPSPNVGTSTTFTWTFTARHATLNWQYWIGNDLLATFPGDSQQPPAQLSHTVDLSGYSGHQTILAVWNIADTANAFYACVDVNVQ